MIERLKFISFQFPRRFSSLYKPSKPYKTNIFSSFFISSYHAPTHSREDCYTLWHYLTHSHNARHRAPAKHILFSDSVQFKKTDVFFFHIIIFFLCFFLCSLPVFMYSNLKCMCIVYYSSSVHHTVSRIQRQPAYAAQHKLSLYGCRIEVKRSSTSSSVSFGFVELVSFWMENYQQQQQPHSTLHEIWIVGNSCNEYKLKSIFEWNREKYILFAR